MADQIITKQKLVEANANASSWEKYWAGNESENVITRLNKSYPTHAKALRILMENGGIQPFSTEVELLAYVPDVEPTAAKALDTKKVWVWKSGIWSNTGLSELDLAKEYAVSAKKGVNICDLSKILYGHYISYEDGQIGPVSGFVVAGPYEIEGDTEYQVSSDYSQQFGYSDALMNYIGGLPDPGASHKFTTPTNAKYIRLTIPEDLVDTFMLCKSTEFPADYVPFIVTNSDLRVSSNQVQNLFDDVKNDLGVIKINIFDKTQIVNDQYVDYITGGNGYNVDFVAAGPYEINPETFYQFSSFYNQQGAFYGENGLYISGFETPNSEHKIKTPVNAKFIKLSVPKNQVDTLVVAKSNLFPETYLPFGSKKIEGLVIDIDSSDVKTTEIWVSADLSDTDPKVKFFGKNAIQLALDSITDATAKNRYSIGAKKGLYKITKATEFLGYRGYPAMVLTKDHVDIIGQGENNTIVWAELPYNDADIGPSIDGNVYDRSSYQTVYDYSEDSTLKDITFVAKNLRYTIHIDNSNGANATRNFENVGFLFKGDKGSLTAMGCGTSSGEKTYIVGGRSLSDNNVPFASHNNIEFDKPSLWSFKGHNFSALKEKYFAYMQSDGSLLQDQFEMVGCSFGGMAYILGYVEVWLTGNTSLKHDSFNHAEWSITGYGNEPFLFENTVEGVSLRFKSNTVGASTSIRFDKTSSAYSVLIKNNQSNSDASLYTDNREFIDGYIVQDGSVGLAGQAWGCRDLSERIYLYDGGVNYTSLAKRLGNCSTLNKVLGVAVNGVMNTITFNKNYSSMTNAQLLSEINAQLSGAIADFYNYGRDYYPTMTDVAENVYNIGATYIPKGSVVTKSQGTVKLANANDKVYGIALDDIPVMTTTSDGVKKGQGRVLKRGYISTNRSKAHFVLADVTPALGTTFRIENGQLFASVNGTIRVDIDTDVVSINC